jgi:hypothetical protein
LTSGCAESNIRITTVGYDITLLIFGVGVPGIFKLKSVDIRDEVCGCKRTARGMSNDDTILVVTVLDDIV